MLSHFFLTDGDLLTAVTAVGLYSFRNYPTDPHLLNVTQISAELVAIKLGLKNHRSIFRYSPGFVSQQPREILFKCLRLNRCALNHKNVIVYTHKVCDSTQIL